MDSTKNNPLLSSPSSDEHLWINLHDRVDAILDDRNTNQTIGSGDCDVESKRGKLFKEDSFLLISGLDSVSSSLSHLTEALGAAQQGLNDLAKLSPQKVKKREKQRLADIDEQRKAKKQCCPNLLQVEEDSNEKTASDDPKEGQGDIQGPVDAIKNVHLHKAKNLAVSVVSKSASLARELKMIRPELSFLKERCTLLEEENRRLREGFEKGEMAEEDDLVRLQLEALLAEKSRLANENANLTRENQCLHQLVEYHQLTSQGLLPSEDSDGVLLDFSSPDRKEECESEEDEQSKEKENQTTAF